jgi:non-ribosomal peptide synthetase component F
LPIRVRVPGDLPTIEWLRGLQARQADLREHENTPLADIRRWSAMAPGSQLFDSILVFENYPAAGPVEDKCDGLTIENFRSFERTHYPLTLVIGPRARIRLGAIYDTARLGKEAVSRMLGHLRTVLAEMIAAASHGRLRDLEVVSPEEARALTASAGAEYAGAGCLHERFEAEVERHGERIAVVCGRPGWARRAWWGCAWSGRWTWSWGSWRR